MFLRIFSDGGARGNPGPSACGVIVTRQDGGVLYETARFLGRGTNNEAEYHGLITALSLAKDYGATEVEIVMDSELVIKQMRGQYRVKAANLRPHYERARELALGFDRIAFTHVRREHPMITQADALLNAEMDRHR